MKVGMIFECGPKGADQQVCKYLAQRLLPDIEIVPPITLGNKPRLLSDCGPAAANLLREGCERIIIVWDLDSLWEKTPVEKKTVRKYIFLFPNLMCRCGK